MHPSGFTAVAVWYACLSACVFCLCLFAWGCAGKECALLHSCLTCTGLTCVASFSPLSTGVLSVNYGICHQELHSDLKKVQAELSKYTHVNKKALDQFTNFTEQMDELGRRREEVIVACE